MSEAYRIRYSPVSLNDLRDIRDYIGETLKEPLAARTQVSRIREAVRGLRSMPKRHATLGWDPWKTEEIRRMAVGSYVILYSVDDAERVVYIVRIVYGARDLERVNV